MSIDAVRKLVEGRGFCGVITTGVSILVAAMFIVPSTCKSAGMGPGSKPQKANDVVATLGSYELHQEEIARLNDRGGSLTPAQEADSIGLTMAQLLESGYALELASKKNVVITDDSILKTISSQIDQQFEMMKMQAAMQGQFKGTTDAEFDEFLKKSQGKDRAGLKADVLDKIKKNLADPSEKRKLESQTASTALAAVIMPTINISDEDLKKSFQTLEFKRIFVRFGDDEAKAKQNAEKALSELKGGMTFEKAMDLYSGDTPDPGKKPSETKTTLSGRSLVAEPEFKPLLTLKPNETSGLLKLESGYALYRLLSVKENAPADFEKNKEKSRKELVASMAQRQVRTEVDELKKTLQPKFTSKGFELIYRLSKLREQRLTQSEMEKAWDAIQKEAAEAKDELGQHEAALARYSAITSLWASATPQKKQELSMARVEAISQVLNFTESVDLRLELVDAFKEMKKGSEAASALTLAAHNNNDVDQRGQAYFNMINSKVNALKSASLLKPEEEKAIMEEQNRWKSERAERDKAEAERAKQEALERQKAEEERKKAEAEKKNVKPVARDEATKTPNGAGK